MSSRKMKLKAPPSYHKATPEQRYERSNGCGPHNGLAEQVPDHLLGVSINEACAIHDWEYFEIQNEEEREIADRNFLDNMNSLIEENSPSFLKKSIQKIFAKIYYGFVRIFGRHRYESEPVVGSTTGPTDQR